MIKWIVAGAIATLAVVVHLELVSYAVSKNDASWRKELKKLEDDKEKVEDSLREDNRKLEEEKNEKIKSLNARVAVLDKRLLKLPSREASLSQTPEAREACTGAQLYREDGFFLTGEAARAERILTERDYYYEQYEQVRKKLDEQDNP